MKVKIWMMAMVLLSGMPAFSQSDDEGKGDEGKIMVEITREINGEKETFKGEYNSTEEMLADPNYQEFAGSQDRFNFWFGNGGDEDVFLPFDQMNNRNQSFFRFFDGDDEKGRRGFLFGPFGPDSLDAFFNFNFDESDMDELRKQMEDMGVDMQIFMDRFDDEEDQRVKVLALKGIKVTDIDGEEFGKKGKVNTNEQLELDDLQFYPNPSSNGRMKVRFTVPEENELTIKISNLQGKEVFTRYFERFSGTYSEMVDLSGQSDGIYLLEIKQGKKRLVKKIVID